MGDMKVLSGLNLLTRPLVMARSDVDTIVCISFLPMYAIKVAYSKIETSECVSEWESERVSE